MGDKVKGYRCVHHPQILTAYYKCKLHINVKQNSVLLQTQQILAIWTLFPYQPSYCGTGAQLLLLSWLDISVTGLINTVWPSYYTGVYYITACSIQFCVSMLSPVLCGSTRAVIEVPDSSESTPTMKNAASVEVRKTSSHQNTSLQVVLFRNQVSDICSNICFAVHLLCGNWIVFTVRISTFSYANLTHSLNLF